MEQDRKRWNEKYHRQERGRPRPIDSFVLECLERHLCAAGRALDLAAGSGRHALELARRGWEVEAWDVSDEALAGVSAEAGEQGLEVGVRRVDLDEELPGETSGSWDLVLIVNFLDRSLLRRAIELLSPGGLLLFTTFTTEREGEHPSDRWCLAPSELATGVPGFETIEYREAAGRAGWLGRRAQAPCKT
jgi:SAM-dependent methyltransferase